MKRTHRHQLKENDLASSLRTTMDALETRRSQILKALIAIAVVVVAVVAINWYRGRGDAAADQALADAMVVLNAQVVPPSATAEQGTELPAAASLGATGSYPSEAAKLNAALPRLKTAADSHQGTQAGLTARYHYAASLAALGQHAEAITAYDAVISEAGADSLYGRMARMGKADTQVKAGQLDAAIATWKELADSTDQDLPKDAILSELAKAYTAKGQTDEAKKIYTQLIDQHPTSTYAAEARTSIGG